MTHKPPLQAAPPGVRQTNILKRNGMDGGQRLILFSPLSIHQIKANNSNHKYLLYYQILKRVKVTRNVN